ncbi:MAG TPA: biotin--[acetyl-CoA-carboxylase] ligase [Synergistetes bacterium]|nr:biotin--[acetyl-CoA-carboxylase] ligase [Synergistota bacterium]
MRRSTPTKVAVLKKLYASKGETVSGGNLCRDLGLSRQAVWKTVKSLVEDGFIIESVPVKGYRFLGSSGSDLDPSWLEVLLSDCPWGHPVLFWEEIDSTQSPAKEMARQGAPEGVIILADKQTSGRGRLGRRWISPPGGGIYFSVIIRPEISPEQIQTLSLASAMAVQDAILSEYGIQCQLKWPNDILWQDSKLCGILSEVSSEPGMIHYAVTGIGINANTTDFDMDLGEAATSLASILGHDIDRGLMTASVIRRFHEGVRRLESPQERDVLIAEYADRCDTLGKKVRVLIDDKEITGEACGIGDAGNLMVRTGGTVMTFSAADIIHLRSS